MYARILSLIFLIFWSSSAMPCLSPLQIHAVDGVASSSFTNINIHKAPGSDNIFLLSMHVVCAW